MNRQVNGVRYSKGDVIRTKNGNVELLDLTNAKKCIFKFTETGTISKAQIQHIVSGNVSDFMRKTVHGVGYIGRDFKGMGVAIDKEKSCIVWRCMIKRCYNPSARDAKSYKDCSVYDHWHSYANFKDWFDINYPDDGLNYHLDKDLKHSGNKIYSKDNCMFILASENCRHGSQKEYKLINPKGEKVTVISLRKFCIENNLGDLSMRRLVSGKYSQHKGWRLDSE